MCLVCASDRSMATWAIYEHATAPGSSEVPTPAPASPFTVAPTGIQNIDGLLWTTSWTGPITYSFPDTAADYEPGYSETTALGFGSVSFAQMQAARYILEGASPYIGGPRMGLTAFAQFTNAAIDDAGFDGADIRIATSSAANPTAYAYLPHSAPAGGDVWFGTSYDFTGPVLGTYSYHAMIHELGHALGLKHGHELNGVANVSLEPAFDSMEFSVMTYRSYVGHGAFGYTNEFYGYAQTFMMYDIAALQHLYGANFATNASATTYSWDPLTGESFLNGVGQGQPGGNRVFQTIWDGGGEDTYDFSSYSASLTIDLSPGAWCVLPREQTALLGWSGQYARGSIFNALQYQGDPRSLIENAIGGAAADTLRGNIADNDLVGGGGNDSLFGLSGNDTLAGSAGNDILDGGEGADVAEFSGEMSSYMLIYRAGIGYDVKDRRPGSEGNDRLIGVEIAEFSDQAFTFGTATGPTGLSLSNSVVDENTPAGTIVGNLSVDSSAPGTVTYEFADPQSLFRIDGASIVTSGTLDFEAAQQHSLSVVATDSSRVSAERTFVIQVGDLPDTVVVPPVVPLVLKGGARNDRLYGGAGNDSLYGYGGNDVLRGAGGNDKIFGGTGRDVLTGGSGKDFFVFNSKPHSKVNYDRITDFIVRDDTIWLENAVFKTVGKGSLKKPAVLSKAAFWVGDKAHDASDRIIYNKKNGYLYYDADGTGSGQAVLMAVLSKNLKLTHKDFYVI